MRRTFRLLIAWVMITFGVVLTAHARNGVSKPPAVSTGATHPTVFVSACRFAKVEHQNKYTSDLNTLTSLRDGSFLIYVLDIGRDGPQFRKIDNHEIYYTAFNLLIANELTAASHRDEPAMEKKSTANKRQIEIYTRPDGTSFQIEWLASVTFDKDSGQGGYLEGQGGMLSNAEYDDIVAYIQTQPFFLVRDWHRIFEMNIRACAIRWTETDRYMSPASQGGEN